MSLPLAACRPWYLLSYIYFRLENAAALKSEALVNAYSNITAHPRRVFVPMRRAISDGQKLCFAISKRGSKMFHLPHLPQPSLFRVNSYLLEPLSLASFSNPRIQRRPYILRFFPVHSYNFFSPCHGYRENSPIMWIRSSNKRHYCRRIHLEHHIVVAVQHFPLSLPTFLEVNISCPESVVKERGKCEYTCRGSVGASDTWVYANLRHLHAELTACRRRSRTTVVCATSTTVPLYEHSVSWQFSPSQPRHPTRKHHRCNFELRVKLMHEYYSAGPCWVPSTRSSIHTCVCSLRSYNIMPLANWRYRQTVVECSILV